jgi:hypothetical protein
MHNGIEEKRLGFGGQHGNLSHIYILLLLHLAALVLQIFATHNIPIFLSSILHYFGYLSLEKVRVLIV